MEEIKRFIDAASGRIKADMVLKNPWIVDVFTQEIHRGDVAITGGSIVGIGKYKGETEIDCEGLYVTPAFIDSHVHIESSKVIPEVFSRVLINRGVMSCIADPHEIANVMGLEGIRYMLDSINRSVIDIYLMIPSCVPAVEFEDNGAVLDAGSLKEFVSRKNVLGLAEVMDVPSVINSNEGMLEKIRLFSDGIIDGHCPKMSSELLNAYICSGIRTNHECSSPAQAEEEIRRGMYIMLREGSAAKNINDLLPAVNEGNYHRFLFCTDDRDISDIYNTGSIDNNIRISISMGLDPVKAYTIASLNAAQCYNIRNTGAVAPGFKADLVLLKSLEDVEIVNVIRKGLLYKESEKEQLYNCPDSSMNIDYINEDMLKISCEPGGINVIKVTGGSIETERVMREPIVDENIVKGIKSCDSMKIGVFERHKRTGRYALGFIEGLGLSGCSVAQTIAHDSHNIIAAGDNDYDMALAVNRVIGMKGGIAIASGGQIVEELALPAAGLMASDSYSTVVEKLERLDSYISLHEKNKKINVFQTLAFMALPVIPRLKLTTRGLYDSEEGKFVSLFNGQVQQRQE